MLVNLGYCRAAVRSQASVLRSQTSSSQIWYSVSHVISSLAKMPTRCVPPAPVLCPEFSFFNGATPTQDIRLLRQFLLLTPHSLRRLVSNCHSSVILLSHDFFFGTKLFWCLLYKNWQETFCSSKSMNADQKTFVKCQSGFALVVALSLMAFTLLLILSITSLIQVETINASRALDQLRARENARLGLMVGLGDLQKFVGADLIVTATADAIGEPNVDYNINAKHWTGRWTSDGNGGVLANPIWLVSGDTPDPLAGAGASSVAIFPATTDDAEVRVPLMPINGQNNTNSSYAYWLTDESNKARINLDSISSLMTYLTTDSERQNISEAYQPFPAQDKIFDVLDPIKNTDTATFSRIFNRLQVPLVEPSIDAQDAYHNFTLASQSVLTDMINGGLKQNLTGRTLIQMNNLLSEADYLDDN